MKRAAASIGLVSTTLLLTAGLLWLNPFDLVSSALDSLFGAAPRWTQVSNLDRNPLTQEVSHGDRVRTSLGLVVEYWHSKPEAPKVVLIGNSQMFAMSLAPGERPQTGTERTYPDLVAQHFAPSGVLCYRLAAPGMSYSEALWYVDYLLVHGTLRPSALVVQVNYQAFWNGGIRDSLLDLLEDAPFRERVIRRAQSGEPYADDFRTALRQFDLRRQRSSTVTAGGAHGFGTAIEDRLRAQLERLSLFRRRSREKESFEEMLYRGRLYFLRIKPSSARSISGPRLTRSQAALDALAATCRDEHVRLVLFTAPLNPSVSIYTSTEERGRFESFVRGLGAKHNARVFDLEHSVAADLWGRQYNGPDPLHMGRRAHQLVAQEIVAAVDAALRGSS